MSIAQLQELKTASSLVKTPNVDKRPKEAITFTWPLDSRPARLRRLQRKVVHHIIDDNKQIMLSFR